MPRTYVHTAFGGPETERFDEVDIPVPAAGQVLIKVRAAGVNPADWKRRSNYNNYLGDVEPLLAPQPMGIEAAGTVVSIGDGVDGLVVGDEVFGNVAAAGAWGDYSLLNGSIIAKKPPEVAFVDAATLPVAAATAYDGIRQLDLTPGQVLLILGAGGGVGIAAAQIAVAEGVTVIGIASGAKAALLDSVGAIHVVYGEGVAERVRSVAPDGVDAIYDMVGGDALKELGPLVKSGTRIVTAASPESAWAAALELGGSRVARSLNSATLEAVAALVAVGTLKPFVTATFPLDQVGAALALVESGHSSGKVVIEVG